jgi:hypothetical protein
MAIEQFVNDIQSTLSAALTTEATTVKVESATGFPASAQYRIRIDSEIMLVTAGAGTKEWTVTRGAEGTTPGPHLKGAVTAHVLTAGSLTNLSLPKYSAARGLPGIIAPPGNMAPTAAVALTASRAYWARFMPSEDITISSASFLVTVAAGADDACDIGIYDSTLATRIASAGATTGKLNSVGIRSVSVSASLTAGTVYYAAFSVGTFGSTGATLRGTATTADAWAQLFSNTPPGVLWGHAAASHPLPTGPVTLAVANTAVPYLVLV